MFYDIPNDPTYTKCKIGDLCAYLGYPANNNIGRLKRTLRDKTVHFRKWFKEKHIPSRIFPIDTTSFTVDYCARFFLASNTRLFPESSDASSHGWPTYPNEQEKIVLGLAKLMCIQELYWRRSENAKVARETAVELSVPHKNNYGPELGERVNKRHDAQDSDEEPSESESEDDDRLAIARNIQLHLNYVYPMNIPPQASSLDSLFTVMSHPQLDLERIDPFSMRYIHEHCLYHCRPANEAAFAKFARHMYDHYDMDCEEKDLDPMRQLLKVLVIRIVRIWGEFEEGGFGLLVGLGSEVIRKTAGFEVAWKVRRGRWIQQVHGGSTDGLLEIQHPLDSTAPRAPNGKDPRGQKRVLESLPRPDESRPKRHRVVDLTFNHLEGPNICVESPDFEEIGSSILAKILPRCSDKRTSSRFNQHKDSTKETANSVLSSFENLRRVPQGATPTPFTNEVSSQLVSSKPNNASKVALQNKCVKSKPVPAPPTARGLNPQNIDEFQINKESSKSTEAPLLNHRAPNVRKTFLASRGATQFSIDTPRTTENDSPPVITSSPTSAKNPFTSQVSNGMPVLQGLSKPPVSTPRAIPKKPTRVIASSRSSCENRTTKSARKAQVASISSIIADPTAPTAYSCADDQEDVTENPKTFPIIALPDNLRNSLNQLQSDARFQTDDSNTRWEGIKSKLASSSKHSLATTQSPGHPTTVEYPSGTQQPDRSKDSETEKSISTPKEDLRGAPKSSSIPSGSDFEQITSADYHTRTSLPSQISRSGSTDASMHRNNSEVLSPEFVGLMDTILAPPAENDFTRLNSASDQDDNSMKSPGVNSINSSIPSPCQSPRKPTLQFAIQDADGIPDDTPSRFVSLKKISSLRVADFFKLVELRSGKSADDFDCVTLRYQWGDRLAHVANRRAGDECWKAATKKMENVFFNATKEFRKKEEFLVWVTCGDRTNLVEESDGQEGDEMED